MAVTEGPGTKEVENEIYSEAVRTSKEGRKFSYRLRIIQQPERARACGSGAKSSADRRPVDPPPILELQIFEGEQDVTFSMNANYFLFTTLESARHMAVPRGSTGGDVKNSPMLTGTPVAGMVCLERPHPAGYFIFPDLSVRNEGWYRLSFALYEELKDTKDDDHPDAAAKSDGLCEACVTHRLEVKSVPFQVYSAKKFPGLTESTSLSRTVAEQGCRVRIRRDVRMRKRESKGAKWDVYEEQTAEARARMSAAPEGSVYGSPAFPDYQIPRPRSGSNASHHSVAPSLTLSRRQSQQDLQQAYQAPGYNAEPHTPQSAYPPAQSYGPSPGQSYPQPPFAQHQAAMQPPLTQYTQQSYAVPQPVPSYLTSQDSTGQQGYYGYGNAAYPPQAMAYPPHPQSSNTTYHSHRQSVELPAQAPMDTRRSSGNYGVPPPSSTASVYPRHEPLPPPNGQQVYQPQPLPPQHSAYSAQPMQQPASGTFEGYGHKPEPMQPPTRTTGAVTPFRTSISNALAPLNTNNPLPPISYAKGLEPASPLAATSPSGLYSASSASHSDSHKRSYGSSFNTSHLNQPLRHGARPNEVGHYYPHAEVDDGEPEQTIMNAEVMKYRRSDGRHMERPLQPQN